MIIPVAFAVQREDTPESFVIGLGDLLPSHVYEKMRIRLILLDTESNKARGFSALVMVDESADVGHEMMTLYSSHGGAGNWASAEYLRELCDEVDRQIQLLEANDTE